MRIMKTAVRSRTARIGVVVAVTTAGLVGTALPASAATPAVITPSTVQGPSGGGNTIVLNTPAPTPAGTSGFAPGTYVEFQMVGTGVVPASTASVTPPTTGTTACWPTYLAAIAPATATAGVIPVTQANTVYYSPNREYVTVPTGANGLTLASGQTAAKYHICAYSSNTTGNAAASTLIANTAAASPYAIANKATVTSVTPASGPAQGRISITVVGTNFTPFATGATSTTMTATLGGQPLNITAVAADGTSFTANIPSHSASSTPVDLIVTTAGGTNVFPGVFTYTNGIVIQPDTEPNTTPRGVYLDIQGVGFAGLTFTTTSGATPDDSNAHVYLVNGIYNPTSDGSTPAHKVLGETAECIDVRVIADNELICSPFPGFSISNGATALTTRTLRVTTPGSASNTITAVAPDTFTSADIGLPITGTDIGASSVITAIGAGGTTATVDVVTGGAGGTNTATISPRVLTVTTAGTTALTVASLPFFAADASRAVSGFGIVPVGATLVGPVSVGAAATLSAAALTTGATQSIAIGNPAPVPNGVYTVTIVSNGSVGATGYSQSIISSGSTFTVAGY